jgi:hypothetical protein
MKFNPDESLELILDNLAEVIGLNIISFNVLIL